MFEHKQIGKVFASKFVGTGPSSYEKRIYRAAVSQRLRNTELDSLFVLWFTNSGQRIDDSCDLTYLRLDDFTFMLVLCVVLGYREVESGGWLQKFRVRNM